MPEKGARRRVLQILAGAASHDAITSMALRIENDLRGEYEVTTFSYHSPDQSVAGQIHPLSELPPPDPDAIIMYHLSFGLPDLVDVLLSRVETLVISYHNITPSRFYIDLLPEFALALDAGRRDMLRLVERTSLAVCDSQFNAEELLECGFCNVRVMPAGVDPWRLRGTPSDAQFLMELSESFPEGFLLFVSQVLPHKRVDHALSVVHLLNTVHQLPVGLVVAGPIRQPAYSEILSEFQSTLHAAKVLFTNTVSEAQLAALYRSCLCFVGTSQHEGLSVPPLEAMAEGAPVVVRGAGAVGDTVGSGGIVLPAEGGVLELAETLAEVIRNTHLATVLRIKGRERLRELALDSSRGSILSLFHEEGL